jgi:hypothetical protein
MYVVNPGLLLLDAVAVGSLGAAAAARLGPRSLWGAVAAGAVAAAALGVLAAAGLVMTFEGGPEGFWDAMRGQGLPMLGQAAALSAVCGAGLGALVPLRRGRPGHGSGGSAEPSAAPDRPGG